MDQLIDRIKKADIYISEWLIDNNKTLTRPPEIEEYLESKGLYKVSNKPGGNFRKDLRELEKLKKLDVFSHVTVYREPNKWFFIKK